MQFCSPGSLCPSGTEHLGSPLLPAARTQWKTVLNVCGSCWIALGMAPRQRPEDTPVRLLRSVAERLEPQKPNGGKRSKRDFCDFRCCGMSWSSWAALLHSCTGRGTISSPRAASSSWHSCRIPLQARLQQRFDAHPTPKCAALLEKRGATSSTWRGSVRGVIDGLETDFEGSLKDWEAASGSR